MLCFLSVTQWVQGGSRWVQSENVSLEPLESLDITKFKPYRFKGFNVLSIYLYIIIFLIYLI